MGAETITEKDRRIYYQSIVYSVCAMLDSFSGGRGSVQCGTKETPSTGVQDTLAVLIERARKAEAEIAAKDAALRWLLNLAHDVGKSGGRPEPGEWEEAWGDAECALSPSPSGKVLVDRGQLEDWRGVLLSLTAGDSTLRISIRPFLDQLARLIGEEGEDEN